MEIPKHMCMKSFYERGVGAQYEISQTLGADFQMNEH